MSAKTVCVAFERWADAAPFAIHSQIRKDITDYIPGEFYRRELPCILGLLDTLEYDHVEAIVIDGFVHLDDALRPGLGAHLFNAIKGKIPVIGVAKTNFASIHQHKRELYRGESQRPLYITSASIDLDNAMACIKLMHGPHRIPTLLKLLDQKTKA